MYICNIEKLYFIVGELPRNKSLFLLTYISIGTTTLSIELCICTV